MTMPQPPIKTPEDHAQAERMLIVFGNVAAQYERENCPATADRVRKAALSLPVPSLALLYRIIREA